MQLGCNTKQWVRIAVLALAAGHLWAGEGGSLLGSVTDPAGRAVPGARVTATETATAVKHSIAADGRGFYVFRSLPVGQYDLEVDATGFKPLRRTGVEIDVNAKVVVDVSLTIGDRTETVTVSDSAAHVETADTQLGEVVTGKQLSRDWYDCEPPITGEPWTAWTPERQPQILRRSPRRPPQDDSAWGGVKKLRIEDGFPS